MIPTNVICRIFQLRWNDKFGTCFTIDIDGKQYICTAKHCVEDFDSDYIEIFHEGTWKKLGVELAGYGSKDTDICVMSPEIQLSPSWPVIPTAGGMLLGQDVFFLGFPYGIRTEHGDFNRRFPVPLVKRATFSAMTKEKERNILFLDGHNNPGFSGGPVVFCEGGKPGTDYRVASVISGYRFEPEKIIDDEGNETQYRYHSNTGIIISYNINHALDVIRNNPIGFEIPRD